MPRFGPTDAERRERTPVGGSPEKPTLTLLGKPGTTGTFGFFLRNSQKNPARDPAQCRRKRHKIWSFNTENTKGTENAV